MLYSCVSVDLYDDYSQLLDFNLMKGLTALCSAALDGRLETVRYLLDNGADPNKKDELGEVALHCAAKFGIISTYSEHSICRCACLKLRTIAEGEVTSVAILPADEGLQHHPHEGDK